MGGGALSEPALPRLQLRTPTFAGRNKGKAEPVKVVAVSIDTAAVAGGGQ
jgi:hypothetical protein